MSEPPTIFEPPPPPSAIETDAPCLHCGYNLRGLPAEANCPECGTPAEDSRHSYKLQNVPTRWFTALRIGIVIILIARSIDQLWSIVRASFRFYPQWTPLGEALLLICLLAVTIASWWGVQLIADRDTSDPLISLNHHRRRARLAINVWLAFYFANRLIPFLPHFMIAGWYRHVGIVTFTLDYALSGWVAWSLFTLLADVNQSMDRKSLARLANFTRWAFAGSYVIYAALYALMLPLEGYLAGNTGFRIFTLIMVIPALLAFVAAAIIGIVVLLRTFHWLGHFRRFAPADSVESRSPWIPEALLRIRDGMKFLRRAATYHGNRGE